MEKALKEISPVPCRQKRLQILRNFLNEKIIKFPKFCDVRLIEGLEKIHTNSSRNFFSQREFSQLSRLLFFQFFLQKRADSHSDSHCDKLFFKLFLCNENLCLIAFFLSGEKEQAISKNLLVRTLQTLVPGSCDVSNSFWKWFHPDRQYLCFYIEMQKLRGSPFTTKEVLFLKSRFEESLRSQILTPSIFWPLNEEEIYKQLCILINELHSQSDLPQVTIQFRHQIENKLEFLVIIARPKNSSLIDQEMEKISPSATIFLHFSKKIESPFLIEAWCFSLFLHVHHFIENHTINLFRARTHVTQLLQKIIGNFRDYNGGMLEIQKDVFSDFSEDLVEKIPYFSQFAYKAFHALQPVEARFTIARDDFIQILQTISSLISQPKLEIYTSQDETILILKSQYQDRLQPLIKLAKQKKVTYSFFDYMSFWYICIYDKSKGTIQKFKSTANSIQKSTTLKLIFFEGIPPSFSPYLAGGDMRCLVLSKLLFEGLMRIDPAGFPKPAAAKEFTVSTDRRKYIFNLRSSNWSNGQPVTAFDYINGWKKILSRQWICNRPYLLFIIKNGKKFYQGSCGENEVGLKAIDSHILQIELEYADPHFLEKLAQPVFFPSYGSTQEPTVFNGPYIVMQNHKNQIELGVNPNFWDAHSLFFQSMNIRWNLPIDEVIEEFENRSVDWIGDPLTPLSTTHITNFQEKKLLKQKKALRFFLIYLNTNHPLINSRLIRKALSLSLNRTFICKNIFYQYDPLYQSVPLIDSSNINENLLQARELFQKALFDLKLAKMNIPKLILNCVKRPEHIELARYFQRTWKEAFDLDITINELEWNTFYSNLEKKQFHMAGCFMNAFSKDPSEFLQRFENRNGLFNFSDWEDDSYRSTVEDLSDITEPLKQTHIFKAAAILADETPYIPICTQNLLYVKNPKLKGELFDIGGCVDFRYAFLEK